MGSSNLYEFLHDNPGVDFYPSDYVNDPFIIARHNRMVSMNVAKAVDLSGQVAAEAVASTLFAGVSGIPDFVRGAKRSPGGKSILMLPSMSADGKTSSIVPTIQGQSVGLFEAAKGAGLIGADRSLGEARRAVYPVKLEETIEVDGESLIIRPAKPVDERRIQEHYYALDKQDIFSRFFHEKSSFGHSDLETKSQIDYIKDMTLIGVIGEAGFGRVVAVGEYLLLFDSNMAEVAFSVSKDFQGKGLGRIFLRKLAESARENGISGLIAYTSPKNRAMIRLFKTLPYKVKTSFDGEALALSCKFDQLADVVGG
ncbi:MAG: GNAT family N-acetyltransferase [Desulfosarcinaceae bacterium]